MLVVMFHCLAVKESVLGSLYDPHVIPTQGPFFEGWYLRILDLERQDSLGLLFGNVLPANSSNDPLVVMSLLQRKCDSDRNNCVLKSLDGKYNSNELKINVNGHPVSADPDLRSPANFRWEVNGAHGGGFFQQKGNKTTFSLKLADVLFRGEIIHANPWNADGTGPEGWLVRLPLPLHWFVYSLASPLVFYEYQNTTSGHVIRSERGLVHMEKNWGRSFPRKWIWSEGIDPATNTTFAMSGGEVNFRVLSVDAYLIGIRNPATDMSLDFRPDNSKVSATIDGCSGSVNITATTFLHKVSIHLSAASSTFSNCLLGPEETGFRPACVESYDAVLTVNVYRRTVWFPVFQSIGEHVIRNAALEFGGLHVCKQICDRHG